MFFIYFLSITLFPSCPQFLCSFPTVIKFQQDCCLTVVCDREAGRDSKCVRVRMGNWWSLCEEWVDCVCEIQRAKDSILSSPGHCKMKLLTSSSPHSSLHFFLPSFSNPPGKMEEYHHGASLSQIRSEVCMCFCVCVCEGEKRPIKEQRGQVCSYCFSLSPWKPMRGLTLNWCSAMDVVCVCCVFIYMGLWAKLKCQEGSVYDTVHGRDSH